MDVRRNALRHLIDGDLFHATSPNGASLICLVTAVDGPVVHARTITTQIVLAFDRHTGIAEWGEDRVPCTINSIAPVPPDIYRTLVGLDTKHRFETDLAKLRLSDAEQAAFRFIGPHYANHPL